MTARGVVERNHLARIADEYRRRGYRVYVEPSPAEFDLPTSQRPDLVAVGQDETVIVEVRTTESLREGTDLQQLAELVKNRGQRWRFELVVANPIESVEIPDEAPITEAATAKSRAEEALSLVATHPEAALLLAWSALEGALRLRERKVRDDSSSAWLNIKQLYSLALLSESQYRLLQQANRIRSRVAHGRSTKEPLHQLVESVANLAKKLADPTYPTIEEMVEWFFDNYEDPAQHVPHDSGEGGYQYFAGGPYDAEQELQKQFPKVEPEDLRAAAEQVEADGYAWVRKGQY
jgi:hypothetical protein